MAKQLLASTPLASQLTNNPLVSVTTGCRMDAAVKTLHDHHILSIPVMNKGVSEIGRRGSAGCPVRLPPQGGPPANPTSAAAIGLCLRQLRCTRLAGGGLVVQLPRLPPPRRRLPLSPPAILHAGVPRLHLSQRRAEEPSGR